VVELNGVLVPEKRPDRKERVAVYLALMQYIEALRAGLEYSYRYYEDTFDIQANTLELAWYQEVGDYVVLRPQVRFHEQSAAGFYGVRFDGSPDVYSSDFRLSAFEAISVGLRATLLVHNRFSLDAGYEHYDQTGFDGKTNQSVYPWADIYSLGGRIWF
jgi:hypothetical protein